MKPLNLLPHEARAARDGSLGMVWRPVVPQPNCSLEINDESVRCSFYDSDDKRWSSIEGNPNLAERRLYGGGGWQDLLPHQAQHLWEKGVRGVVPAYWPQKQEGVLEYFIMPSREKEDPDHPSTGLHGIPRNAAISNESGAPPRREPAELRPIESQVGNAGGELDRQENTQQAGKQHNISLHSRGEKPSSLGSREGTLQREPCFQDARGYPQFRVKACPWEAGSRLYGREPWQYADWTEDGEPFIGYRSDGERRLITDTPEEWGDKLADIWATLSDPANYAIDSRAADRRWRSAAIMPRWASRTTLRVVSVVVKRVGEVTEEEARAWGMRIPVTKDGCPKGKVAPLLTISGPIMPHEFSKKRWTDWTEEDFYRFEFALEWQRQYRKRYPWPSTWAWGVRVERVGGES